MTPPIQNVVDFPAGAVADRRGATRGRDPDALLAAIEFRLAEIEGEMDAALIVEDFAAAQDWAQRWTFLSRQRRTLRERAVDARMGSIRALGRSA